jgi:hypothetical protein
MKEHALHSQVKTLYALHGDQCEARVGRYIVDILRGDTIIEVQTKNFSALKEKIRILTIKHPVKVVYPLPQTKWITYVDNNNLVTSHRKSPRRGRLIDVVHELVMIPEMIRQENFSLEVLLIDEEEVRCADGRGSWRRRGVSIKERKLLRVTDRVLLKSKADYLRLLPNGLSEIFTNKELAKQGRISIRTAREITYCLRKSQIVKVVGKKGGAFLFKKCL